jgi:hypothetical protein
MGGTGFPAQPGAVCTNAWPERVDSSAHATERADSSAHPTGRADGSADPAERVDASADPAERAARRTLRDQISRLERELADAFVTAYPMGGLDQPAAVAAGRSPRLLDLGELELLRDDLAGRLRDTRISIARRAEEQAERRRALERMLLNPAEHRFERIWCRELGQPGCGAWQVRPRLGLIGMLMGWWQVKLSSGCPLAGGHAPARPPAVTRCRAAPPGRRACALS